MMKSRAAMLHPKFQSAVAILCSTLLAGTLLLSGCGRSPLEPDSDATKPGVEEPEEPGEWEDPGEYPFEPADPGAVGGDTPGNGGGAKPPSAPGNSGLRPLPAVTPTPGPKGNPGSGADPAAAIDKFVDTLQSFGYAPASGSNAAYNIRMQLLPLTRVPAARFHWVTSDTLGLTYGRRKGSFPKVPATMKEWLDGGLALARRDAPVSWYVARRDLYRDIFRDRYKCDSDACELVFYKRLNKTGMMVCYRANGEIIDYGFFPEINWREFIAVPDAILR